jgi:hypothetical protein
MSATTISIRTGPTLALRIGDGRACGIKIRFSPLQIA